jgi:hypothetical protein
VGAFFGDALADVRARDGVLPGGWGHGGKARPVCESWLELTKAPLRFFVFKKISEASSPRTRREGRPSPPRAAHSSLASSYDADGDVRADRAMRAHALACSRAQCATPASGASSFPHHANLRTLEPRSDDS